MTAARPDGTSTPGYSETMPCAPESARRARQLIATALKKWTFDDLTDTGTLIVSELVANAIAHTPCRLVHICVRRTGEALVRIAVCDTSRAVPMRGTLGSGSEAGRGLLLVDALSDRWGYQQRCRGKIVWAGMRPKAKEPTQ